MMISKEVSVYTILAQFRCGFQRIQRIGWVSPSALHASVVGVLAFACGFVLSLKGVRMGTSHSLPWSQDGDSSIKILFVPGLRNLGNNCFLNVILQALASCASFHPFLQENVEELNLESSLNQEQIERLPLSAALIALFEDLGNMATSNGKIVIRERIEDASEPKKWKQRCIGPFDGILSSFLVCQSCSSEILLDSNVFHTLSLSPVVDAYASIVDKCTLEDCLKRFVTAERVENYHSTHCWHLAAMKYLSLSEGYEAEMRKLRCCSKRDSCNCRNLPCLQGLQWSDRFSCTVKQLSIVHCPKILCLQIQRSSVNIYGELVKNQGHITLPMILDLSPFVNSGVGMRKVQDEMPRPLTQQLVEHFGQSGSGHYTVYRGAGTDQDANCLTDSPMQWFSVLDSLVGPASEEKVLAADSTLLFYEKLDLFNST